MKRDDGSDAATALRNIVVWRRDPWAEEVHFFIDESGRSGESEMVVVAVASRSVQQLRDIVARARRDLRFADYFRRTSHFHAAEAGECAGLVEFVLGEFVRLAQVDRAEVMLARIHNCALARDERGFRAYRRALQALIAIAAVHRARAVHVHIATLFNDGEHIEAVKAAVGAALERKGLPTMDPVTGDALVHVRPASTDAGLQIADAVAYAAYGRFAAPQAARGRASGAGSKAAAVARYVDRLLELGRLQDTEIPPPKTKHRSSRWRPDPPIARRIAARAQVASKRR